MSLQLRLAAHLLLVLLPQVLLPRARLLLAGLPLVVVAAVRLAAAVRDLHAEEGIRNKSINVPTETRGACKD